MEIGKQIRQRRMDIGLSQEELAEQLFITCQTLSNWETGKLAWISTVRCD